MNIKYDNGLHPGGRGAWSCLKKDAGLRLFRGKNPLYGSGSGRGISGRVLFNVVFGRIVEIAL